MTQRRKRFYLVLSFTLFIIFAIHGSVTLLRSVRSSVTDVIESSSDYFEMDCGNTYDDDGDGDADCADSDCSSDLSCQAGGSSSS